MAWNFCFPSLSFDPLSHLPCSHTTIHRQSCARVYSQAYTLAKQNWMFLNTFVSTTLFLKCPLFYLSKYLYSPRICSRFPSFVRLSLKHHTKLCFFLWVHKFQHFLPCVIFSWPLVEWPSHSRLPRSFQVLKLKVPDPGKPRSPRQTEVVGHPAGRLLIGGWVSAVKGLFPIHPCVPGA